MFDQQELAFLQELLNAKGLSVPIESVEVAASIRKKLRENAEQQGAEKK